MDHILDMMEKKGWPMLLSVYLEIAFCGEVRSLNQLGPEDRSLVEDYLSRGLLKVPTEGSRRKQ
jgi:hypothetical protein